MQTDDLIPSRFAMIFDKPHRVGFDMSFISMGETTNDGLFIDVGNNVLSYKSTNKVEYISNNFENYLKDCTYI